MILYLTLCIGLSCQEVQVPGLHDIHGCWRGSQIIAARDYPGRTLKHWRCVHPAFDKKA